MKKFLAKFGLLFIFMTLALSLHMGYAEALTSNFGPLKQIQSIGEGTGLPGFATGQHPDAPADYIQPGVGTATSPIYFALDMFRYVVSGIAILVIVIQAIKLVSTANDEEAAKAKMTVIVGVIGLLVIQVADFAVKNMFFGEQGEAFRDKSTTELFAKETVSTLRGIIGLIEAFVGASAVLILVIRGFVVITSTGDEEAVSSAKKHVIYALVGMATVVLSEVIVRGVVFPEAGKEIPDIQAGRFIIINIVNYLAGFVSILAFVGLFYGGYRYVMAAGDEEFNDKIKKIIVGSLIALILALGSFALVNTFLEIPPVEEDINLQN